MAPSGVFTMRELFTILAFLWIKWLHFKFSLEYRISLITQDYLLVTSIVENE